MCDSASRRSPTVTPMISLHEIRGFPLLTGHRGRPAADLPALRDALLRMSCLAECVPEIAELDLNPVIALAPGAGCRVVDARIRVALPTDQLRRTSSK